MIAQRFAVASSFLVRMNPRMTFVSRIHPKMTIQELSISSKTADPSQVIPSPSLSKIDLRKAIKKRNDEDLALMGELIASKARNSNFIFSPASINSAYTMMAARYGFISDELKAVFSEIATVVFADGSASGGPKFSYINGFWVEQTLPVDHPFKDLIEKSFKATYAEVDFRSKAEEIRLEVNKWAADQTNGLITNLLPPGSVESETNEVSGNALYFKGAWAQPFQKWCTKNKKFHLVNGSSVSVPFMSSKEEQYVKAYNGFKVLRLPYRKGDDDTNREFSMYFYLPDKKDGLDELVKKMTSTPGFVDKHIPYHKDKVDNITIPKFKISFMFKASKEEEKLHIYHSACVEIDEKGARAAAATAMVRYSFSTLPKIDFVADHPFLFLIREDKTGTILFAGQIFDPSKKSS
ncbi:PREDICTED: serpin-Z1-like [Camelina sativa]|uniref:Serpin-Z1-like n=1 Tax=Camelina sativa TaxID=90675 RepID=A0ABM0TSC6_CAMSA|nr:PREDICTED: serpin-Z1-like [Camelina sativa]